MGRRTGGAGEAMSWKLADGGTLDLKGDYVFRRTAPDGKTQQQP